MADGFKDLEPDICTLVRAANLAMFLTDDAGLGSADASEADDLLLFTITELQTRAEDFKKKYYQLYGSFHPDDSGGESVAV